MSAETTNKTKERGNYWSVRAIVLLYRFGGKFLMLPMVYLVTTYFFLTSAKTRACSRAYLSKVANCNGSIQSVDVTTKLVWKHYMEFALALVNRISAWMGDTHYTDVEFPERGELENIQGKNQGSVILGAHFGNMDMCRALVSKNNALAMNVVVDIKDTENFNQVLKSINPDLGVNLISIGKIDPATAIAMQDKLNMGESLVMFADRGSSGSKNSNISAQFLGKEILLPMGPFRLAVSLGFPVYFITCIRDGNKYKMHYKALWDGVSGNKRSDKITSLVESYIGTMTNLCKQYPLQWFNFYDYWSEFTNKNKH